MQKWRVEGRFRCDVPIDETVEASSEDAAINKIEKIVMKRVGITKFDILDTEYYAEKIK
jgi:hypothetical protein